MAGGVPDGFPCKESLASKFWAAFMTIKTVLNTMFLVFASLAVG